MPAIPSVVLNSIVYIYEDADEARLGVAQGACGFLVGIHSTKRSDHKHIYAVTNWHVAKQSATGRTFIRINKLAGGADVIEFDVDDWHHVPGGGDVAATEVFLDSAVHVFNPTDVRNLLTDETAQEWICVGEDVFMIGRFVDHDGGLINKPAARFGNISMLPSLLRGMQNSNSHGPGYYCIDMHSRGGFSGSPVYAYRTAGSDLSLSFTNEMPALHAPLMSLLGIHCGQFKETLLTDDGQKVTGWSGMTSVLPAWHITALLNCKEFLAKREAA